MNTSFAAVQDILSRHVHQLFFVKDCNSHYLEANENFLSYFGLQNIEQLRNKNDHDLPAAALAQQYIHDDQEAIRCGELQVIEPVLRYDGEWVIMLTHKYSVFEPMTQSPVVVGVARAINDRTIKNFRSLHEHSALTQLKMSGTLFNEKVNQHTKVPLTDRELDVLYYLLHGLSQKQVAYKLDLSVRTVEDHVDHIKTKLRCGNKNQLFEFAIHHGLLNILPKHLLC